MNELEILRKIRELFYDKKNWCQKTYMKNIDGHYSYCLMGAINKFCFIDSEFWNRKLWYSVKEKLDNDLNKYLYNGLIHLNDYGGYEEVMKLLDKTIEKELAANQN